MIGKLTLLGLAALLLGGQAIHGARAGEPLAPSPYEVTWETPSEDCRGTMPLGNGEVALNAWIDPAGDLRFYIARGDSWDEYGRLLKIGAVRVRVGEGAPGRTQPFRQTLTVKDATLRVRYGQGPERVEMRLWVDANRPLICVELKTARPTQATAALELWRNAPTALPSVEVSDIYRGQTTTTVVMADTVVSGLRDSVGWYHRNTLSVGPAMCARLQGVADFARPDPLLHRTFGALVTAERPERLDDRTLRSQEGITHRFEILVHTRHPATAEQWLAEAERGLEEARGVPLASRRAAHEGWWAGFWNRSWIHISSAAKTAGGEGDDAFVVSRAYALQRFINACAGRGRYPIKFNGSLFTVPAKDQPGDADYRRWGPGYWWQNTRLPYYAMCAAGDTDLMAPLFHMYGSELMPLFKYRTRRYLGHGGAFIPECIYFWGDMFSETYGWQPFEERTDKLQTNRYHKWLWVSGLELTGLMLDYADHTGDNRFLRQNALPVAREILTFFDQHYGDGADGKMHMHPAQSLETWWDCVGPMPELAGLHAITGRLLALPEAAAEPADRAFWRRLQARLPELPTTRTAEGKVVLAPAQSYSMKHNVENPELYAVFPFRTIALDKPNLEWGLEALARRNYRGSNGWRQDVLFMAWMGLGDQAREDLVLRARSKDTASRFPVFWGPNFDWVPDQDHGSVLLAAAQSMLLQSEGRRIYLLPAWPADWNAEFKLHAPGRTVVMGKVREGKLVDLQVRPPERRKDVIVGGKIE